MPERVISKWLVEDEGELWMRFGPQIFKRIREVNPHGHQIYTDQVQYTTRDKIYERTEKHTVGHSVIEMIIRVAVRKGVPVYPDQWNDHEYPTENGQD